MEKSHGAVLLRWVFAPSYFKDFLPLDKLTTKVGCTMSIDKKCIKGGEDIAFPYEEFNEIIKVLLLEIQKQ